MVQSTRALFCSEAAKQQHIKYSPDHNICYVCNLDFWDESVMEDLLNDEHPICYDCGERFKNDNNLRMVRRHGHEKHIIGNYFR